MGVPLRRRHYTFSRARAVLQQPRVQQAYGHTLSIDSTPIDSALTPEPTFTLTSDLDSPHARCYTLPFI